MDFHFLTVFLHFLLLVTSTYAAFPQVQYLINCGSSTSTTLEVNRTFVGDVNPKAFHLYSHHSKPVESTHQLPNSTDIILYSTARVFRKASSYAFNIDSTGIYILRFHFCAFSSLPSLSEALFDVTAFGHMLLPAFSVGKNAADAIIVKEFFVDVNYTGSFRVHFLPNVETSSLAFVNAIELFSTRLNFKQVPKSTALETIHRINFGDREVKPSNDTLWRDWVLDDPYLVSKSNAQNRTVYQSVIEYGNGPEAATDDDAPLLVYRTAKELKDDDLNANLTWNFNVSKDGVHLVRMHFCDIIAAFGDHIMNISINEKLVEALDPYTYTLSSGVEAGVPFYRDHIVVTGNLESIKINLAPVNDTGIYLNGLEIMQFRNESALDEIDRDGSSHVKLVVGLVVGSIALILAFAVVGLCCLRRRKTELVEESSEWETIPMHGASSRNRSSERSSSHGLNMQNLHLGLKIPFSYIQKATNNFDANLIIGEGGFGKVYKAVFKKGIKVAVKRSSPDHGQGIDEFQTEIMVLSKIRHRHLVSLIGYCYEGNEMILVYEFMEKGTLREHLYDSRGIAMSSNCLGLSWKQRLEICIGAAKGLHYLHTGADGRIIHRDVKSTNILLDDHFVAKVADFGLSRLGHLGQTHISTEVKGTFGYLDPEYYGSYQLTEKSDVYSFGVLLLEILCARSVINGALPKEQINLAEWGKRCMERGTVKEIIDPSIVGEVTDNALMKFVDTAAKCLKESSEERPPMSDVIWDLEYALLLQSGVNDGDMPGDTMTGASLNMPALGDDSLMSVQSFSDVNEDITLTSTGKVFSQLKVNDDSDTGR